MNVQFILTDISSYKDAYEVNAIWWAQHVLPAGLMLLAGMCAGWLSKSNHRHQ